MAEYLVVYTPSRLGLADDPSEAERAIIADHFAYLAAAHRSGTLVLAGRTLDAPPMGLGVFEAASDGAARRFVDADPAVRGGVFLAEVRPYRVALLAGRAVE
jgi:uncharacterized protein YciI